MSAPECGCRLRGNQHGSWYHPCDQHAPIYIMAAKAKGQTMEEFLEAAVDRYVLNHHPDAKRWLS